MPGPVAAIAGPVRLAVVAMRCRFELLLLGDDAPTLRAAGEEVLAEVRSWDRRLNVYAPGSELSRVNREAARGPVAVSAPLFDLLLLSRELASRTRGAFDPTIGPLVRLWRSASRTGQLPPQSHLERARRAIGIAHLRLNPATRTVAFAHPELELNLNAIAKGQALDAAALILKEAGVGSFLLHGGTSSILAGASPPDADGWEIGLADPIDASHILHRLRLKNAALGVTSQSLQRAVQGDGRLGHVISPLNGEPVPSARTAAVIAPAAAVADALSTALLTSGLSSPNWLLPSERGLMLPRDEAQELILSPNAPAAAASQR